MSNVRRVIIPKLSLLCHTQIWQGSVKLLSFVGDLWLSVNAPMALWSGRQNYFWLSNAGAFSIAIVVSNRIFLSLAKLIPAVLFEMSVSGADWECRNYTFLSSVTYGAVLVLVANWNVHKCTTGYEHAECNSNSSMQPGQRAHRPSSVQADNDLSLQVLSI